jgi:hypothetical protein
LQTELRDLEDLARKMKNALVKKKALSAMPAPGCIFCFCKKCAVFPPLGSFPPPPPLHVLFLCVLAAFCTRVL